ncbi:MAG: tRNA uridine-5-carboxymethylaminomethyl(34) synthesis GTPase MnmE [Nitrospira sp. CR1.1]|jgi:tRNA modification GTPase|nr:tRNA uridine-5-carboxymethylaminomethyl(34) synthesis GTPase MnmE [Nitrospira sp. CR1.1]
MLGALDDTICAIATPPGEGGVGILRISGHRALEVASQVVRLRSGKSLHALRTHQLTLADLRARDTNPPAAATQDVREPDFIDEALVVVMKGPHSFTGEDVVEVQCHGGPVILEQVCRGLLSAGARLADPGEFTKRAFLNGRLDLAQAEAVLDTIRAKTARSLTLAQSQRRGELSRHVEEIRSGLVVALAHVEAALDFAEEDISFVRQDELMRLLDATLHKLRHLVRSGRDGRIWREGAVVAILGRPNVGKSSLMNALLQSDRAIVTPIPGTTRDLLEELVSIDGIPVRLVDTAGIRITDDPIEVEGIRRSRLAWADADLALILLDGSQPLSESDRALLAQPESERALLVVNKCDLPRQLLREDLGRAYSGHGDVFEISATLRIGLDELREAIRSRLLPGSLESNDGVLVTNLRHAAALERALQGVDQARQSVEAGRAGELVAMDLRTAADALGEITGIITTDEILERIFAEFCIGK